MFTPTAAPARALTKSSPYNGPRGQPGPHETNPTAASSRNTGSRTSSRDPTNTSGAAQREIMGPGPRRAVARETRAVVGEEAVVRRREAGGQVELMGVVWEPVDPVTAASPPQLCDVGRSEARALEDEHHVHGPCTQARRQPGGQGAPEQGVPPSTPLLAAAHLTSQPLERGREGQAAPVVATVERRDQYDAQTREGARRHTST